MVVAPTTLIPVIVAPLGRFTELPRVMPMAGVKPAGRLAVGIVTVLRPDWAVAAADVVTAPKRSWAGVAVVPLAVVFCERVMTLPAMPVIVVLAGMRKPLTLMPTLRALPLG